VFFFPIETVNLHLKQGLIPYNHVNAFVIPHLFTFSFNKSAYTNVNAFLLLFFLIKIATLHKFDYLVIKFSHFTLLKTYLSDWRKRKKHGKWRNREGSIN